MWLTIVLAVPALDDRFLGAPLRIGRPELHAPSLPHNVLAGLLAVVVAVLSIRPVANMLSPRQIMNRTFNPLHLVGTYGAFGGITRRRYEVVVEGTLAKNGSTRGNARNVTMASTGQKFGAASSEGETP